MSNQLITLKQMAKYVIKVETKHCKKAGLKPGSLFAKAINGKPAK